jgi:integrase
MSVPIDSLGISLNLPRRKLSLASDLRSISYVLPSLGKYAPKDITPSLVKNWLTSLNPALSGSLVNKALTHVRCVFEMLVDDDQLGKNPARKVSMPKTTLKPKRYLEIEECQRLQAELADQDALMLETFLDCALRPCEVFALRPNDIMSGALRIDEGAVPVEGIKDTKTQASTACVPITPELEAKLRQHAIGRAPDALLFPSENGTPLERGNWLKRVIKPAAARAGVPNVTLQCFRRTTATHSTPANPKVAQAILRHTKSSTTMDYYVQAIQSEVIQGANEWAARRRHSDGGIDGVFVAHDLRLPCKPLI